MSERERGFPITHLRLLRSLGKRQRLAFSRFLTVKNNSAILQLQRCERPEQVRMVLTPPVSLALCCTRVPGKRASLELVRREPALQCQGQGKASTARPHGQDRFGLTESTSAHAQTPPALTGRRPQDTERGAGRPAPTMHRAGHLTARCHRTAPHRRVTARAATVGDRKGRRVRATRPMQSPRGFLWQPPVLETRLEICDMGPGADISPHMRLDRPGPVPPALTMAARLPRPRPAASSARRSANPTPGIPARPRADSAGGNGPS